MTGPALRIRDLVVSAQDRRLLSVPALDLPGGTILGVRGPSGAGKSTLLMALAGLAGGGGAVIWGDTDLMTLTPRQRAAFRTRWIGLIFQEPLLFDDLSAPANAALAALWSPGPSRAAIRQRAAAMLDRLGLPAGGRHVASFSGGERQRVAAARAMATDAPILLADEPTASLDRAAADRLTGDLIAQARGAGRTLVVVSHDPVLLDRCDRHVTVADGTVLA